MKIMEDEMTKLKSELATFHRNIQVERISSRTIKGVKGRKGKEQNRGLSSDRALSHNTFLSRHFMGSHKCRIYSIYSCAAYR